MIELLEANWIWAVTLLAALVLAWLLWGRKPKVRQRAASRDVLDEGAAPARRNAALIDAPPAAAIVPPPVSVGMAGIGEVVSQAAEAEVAAAAVPVAEGPVAEGPIAEGDDLARIKGLGPKLRATLAGLGVTRFEQIAGWSDADLDDLDSKLGSFAGRPRRDNWVEQAKLLSAGDTAGYEAKFGKL
jgi:predicted flap endonuclease-1-like 5' DNA nuclease